MPSLGEKNFCSDQTIQAIGVCLRCLICVVLWGMLFFRVPVSAEIYGQYKGWHACAECHASISLGWQKTRHAQAYASLKKTKQQDLPECIQCHVVGYDQAGGFLDFQLTAELVGVQCENCHGPGQRHVEMPDESGTIIRAVTAEVCRKCHTSSGDHNFNYNTKARLVHGTQ